jgi:hypothetical protein
VLVLPHARTRFDRLSASSVVVALARGGVPELFAKLAADSTPRSSSCSTRRRANSDVEPTLTRASR